MNDTNDGMSMADDAEMAEQYVQWTLKALDDMDRFIGQIQEIGEGDAGARKTLYKEIYGLSHNMKGMGSSFDYLLMTDIGASLCDYIKQVPESLVPEFNVVSAHVRAFRVIITNRIVGAGGEKGQAVLAKLKGMAADSLASI